MSGNGPSATHFDFSQTLIAARSVPAKPEGAPGELAEFPPKFAPIEEPEEDRHRPRHAGADLEEGPGSVAPRPAVPRRRELDKTPRDDGRDICRV